MRYMQYMRYMCTNACARTCLSSRAYACSHRFVHESERACAHINVCPLADPRVHICLCVHIYAWLMHTCTRRIDLRRSFCCMHKHAYASARTGRRASAVDPRMAARMLACLFGSLSLHALAHRHDAYVHLARGVTLCAQRILGMHLDISRAIRSMSLIHEGIVAKLLHIVCVTQLGGKS
jgi:hypothetical protein